MIKNQNILIMIKQVLNIYQSVIKYLEHPDFDSINPLISL